MENVRELNIDVLTGAVNPMPRLEDKGDALLWVKFEMVSHFNDVATREQGRPVFEMREYTRIIVPGDSTQVIHRPVRDSDKERWPTQWKAFENGKEQMVGYPLVEAPFLTRSQVDELTYFKIQTVEQLAGVSDTVCQKFTGLNQLREQAKIYLAQMKGEEPALKLQAAVVKQEEENQALRNQLRMQSEQLVAVQKQIAELSKLKEQAKGNSRAA